MHAVMGADERARVGVGRAQRGTAEWPSGAVAGQRREQLRAGVAARADAVVSVGRARRVECVRVGPAAGEPSKVQ